LIAVANNGALTKMRTGMSGMPMATNRSSNFGASTAASLRPAPTPIAVAIRTVAFVITSISLLYQELRREMNGETNVLAIPRLKSLRCALRGSRKEMILRALGHPSATIGSGKAQSDDTWYYPMDVDRRTVLMVRFDEDRACDFEVISMMPLDHAHAT
jgi:hypothetical protein